VRDYIDLYRDCRKRMGRVRAIAKTLWGWA
jgi:hypothetical protein